MWKWFSDHLRFTALWMQVLFTTVLPDTSPGSVDKATSHVHVQAMPLASVDGGWRHIIYLCAWGHMVEVCDVFVNCHRTENGYNINFFVTNKISSMMFSVILSLKYKLDTQFSMNRNSPQNFLCDEGGLHSDKSFVTEAMISTSGLALSLKFNNVPTDYNPLVSLIMFRW